MQFSPTFYRITAPNPGFMTGNGTNTYLIKSANGQCMVIDPGPAIDSHIEAIIQLAGGAENIKLIALTHMHPDHSPAAMLLAEKTSAALYSGVMLDDEFQDKSFVPQHIIEHNQCLSLNEIKLRCIYTPGHVDNHFCFLYENEHILMTGDHLMQGSTVVIIPPHGNMKKYLASLALLRAYNIAVLAPGHGEFILQVEQEIDGIIAHRLAREQKIIEKMHNLPALDLTNLTKAVYDDVPESLHLMASFSLWAHLIKLKEEDKAEEKAGLWQLTLLAK